MTYARADLVNKAIANLGIVQQTDAGAVRTRAELVSEALRCLGIVQQTDAGAVRTRAELVSEALNCLGVIQQAYSNGTKTRNNLIEETLYKLGVITVGTPASAEDVATIDGNIDPALGDLAARFIVPTTISAAAIPVAWFDAITTLVAYASKKFYGVTGDEDKSLTADAALAEAKLKTLTRTTLVDGKLPSIIAELNARGIATVANLAAIPAAWFPSLADIVAWSIRAEFDVIPDVVAQLAQRAERAERLLKNLTRSSIVDGKLPSIVAELNARAIATVSNLAAIPSAWFPSLADIVAWSVRSEFDVAPEVYAQLAERAVRAERILTNLTRVPFVTAMVDATLAEMAARDVVFLVDDSDIPQEWFLSLAAVLADRSKGYFELDPGTVMRVSQEGAVAVATLRELTRGRPSYLTQRTAYF